jgi:hypothetical protein
MKAILTILTILFLFSCSTDNQEVKTPITTTLETRGVKSFGSKFTDDDKTWILLKLDGTFEASFKEGLIELGNWTLSNENKTLRMVNIRSSDGKGEIRIKEFTVLEFTDDNITLVNSNGEKLELKSE